jgi:hypothetical protein
LQAQALAAQCLRCVQPFRRMLGAADRGGIEPLDCAAAGFAPTARIARANITRCITASPGKERSSSTSKGLGRPYRISPN